MFTIVITGRDSADVYDTHSANGKAEYFISLALHDVVDDTVVEKLPRPLRAPWRAFVQHVHGVYDVRGARGQYPRVYDADGRELTFAQLLSRSAGLFAPVADVV